MGSESSHQARSSHTSPEQNHPICMEKVFWSLLLFSSSDLSHLSALDENLSEVHWEISPFRHTVVVVAMDVD